MSAVEEIDFDSAVRPEHMWDQLATLTEGQHCASQQGDETLTDMSEEDLRHNSHVMDTTSVPVLGRYEKAANSEEIPPDEYRQLVRQLNDKQRDIVMFHRQWCKSALVALRNDQPVKPYRVLYECCSIE